MNKISQQLKSFTMLGMIALFISAMSVSLDAAYASGGGRPPPPPGRNTQPREVKSPQEIELERLYTLGRKTFKKKLTCKKECILEKGVIKRGNARDYLLKINNEPEFAEVLTEEEIKALSVYMIRRYRIEA